MKQNENKLSGIIRILNNSGEVGFSIWGVQEDQKWLTDIINEYLPKVEQDKNLSNQHILKFDTVDDVMKILENSGFMNLKIHQENSVVIYKDKEKWWQEMCSNAVMGIFEQIENLGGHIFEKFKKDVFAGLEKFNKGNGLYFNMPVIYAFGEKHC